MTQIQMRCRCVTRQPVVLPPAAMCKHSTKICGEEKRCLLTGYPIWGSWEHPYSKPTSSAKHRNSLVPERLKTEPMPRSSPSFLMCPFWSSGWLHKQVSILSLSLSVVHTCGSWHVHHLTQLSPPQGLACTARLLQSVMQRKLRPWAPSAWGCLHPWGRGTFLAGVSFRVRE